MFTLRMTPRLPARIQAVHMVTATVMAAGVSAESELASY